MASPVTARPPIDLNILEAPAIDDPDFDINSGHNRSGLPYHSQGPSNVEICSKIEYCYISSGSNSFDSIVSSIGTSALRVAVEDVNRYVPRDRQDLLIKKQTEFKSLLNLAQNELLKRSPAEVSSSKRTKVWQKVKSGLERFCQVVHHYSAVMDVLVSSHPEVAALAWGAMKFLIAVSVNHQELKEKIIEHLADIGEQFKIIDSYVRLFPEADMVEQVGGVYDNFTKFLQLSIDWCRENCIVKFFKNVALPYEARIKPTIDELNKYVKRVKDRVELNNAYRLALVQHDLSALIASFDDNKRLQTHSHAVIAQLLQSMARDKARETEMLAKLEPEDNQLKGMITPQNPGPSATEMHVRALADHKLPFEHLKDCAMQSLQLEADESYQAIGLQHKPEVRSWLQSLESSLLWIDGFAHSPACKWTTEFSVDVMLKAEEQGNVVLFYFADVAMDVLEDSRVEHFALTKTVINSLTVQLLGRHPSLIKSQTAYLTPQHWAKARNDTKGAWDVFQHLLRLLADQGGMIYIILDSIDIANAVNKSSTNTVALLQRLSGLITSPTTMQRTNGSGTPLLTLKILVTSTSGTEHTVLFPHNAAASASPPPSHSIVRIPQTFGQYNVPRLPMHQRKPCMKRLVRLPDSDDEFGFKPSDSFDFSDGEDSDDLAFSSDEETYASASANKSEVVGVPVHSRKPCLNADWSHRMSSAKKGDIHGGSKTREMTSSSEELDFSDEEEAADLAKTKSSSSADDLEFSSSDDEN